MFKLNETRSLQLEISSYCNASCPQCPRNINGGITIPDLPKQNWSLGQFEHVINQFKQSPLELVYFCGTYGDPMMNPHIIKMCEIIRNLFPKCRIGIHTNGGLQYKGVYKRLADVVDFCAFGIDGLEDTNHLYRRKVSWNKVIENAIMFIKNGGQAIWDFIVFEHNQHQVESAKQLSIDLGFSHFNVKKTSRFLNHLHEFVDEIVVENDQGYPEYTINMPTDESFINPGYKFTQKIDQNYLQTTKISCNSCRINEVYIGCEGLVFPCGWLHDRLYGEAIKQHQDHKTMMKLFDEIGGQEKANVFTNTLLSIIDDLWFPKIETQWSNNSIQRCAVMCGSKMNLIGPQNSEITYKE